MWDLVGNSEDRFSHNEAQIISGLVSSLNFFLSYILITFPDSRVSEIPSHHVKKALKHLEGENTVSSCELHVKSTFQVF